MDDIYLLHRPPASRAMTTNVHRHGCERWGRGVFLPVVHPEGLVLQCPAKCLTCLNNASHELVSGLTKVVSMARQIPPESGRSLAMTLMRRAAKCFRMF